MQFAEENSVLSAIALWNNNLYHKEGTKIYRTLVVERAIPQDKKQNEKDNNNVDMANSEDSTFKETHLPGMREGATFELPKEIQQDMVTILKEWHQEKSGQQGLQGQNLSWLKHAWESKNGEKLQVHKYGFRKLAHAIDSIPGIKVEINSKNTAVASLLTESWLIGLLPLDLILIN